MLPLIYGPVWLPLGCSSIMRGSITHAVLQEALQLYELLGRRSCYRYAVDSSELVRGNPVAAEFLGHAGAPIAVNRDSKCSAQSGPGVKSTVRTSSVSNNPTTEPDHLS